MIDLSPVRFDGDAVLLLDQLALPERESWVACKSSREVADAIKKMIVRGAPAIGISAAYGVALAVRDGRGDFAKVQAACDELRDARPTAVNLAWAVQRMERALAAARASGVSDLFGRMSLEAKAIHDEDIAACKAMGRLGGALIPDGATVLTHCNAGALATGGYGTALGVIRGAIEAGKRVKVFADETRPFLQGARLTAWELMKDGIDVTLISDNMAGHFMQRGDIACAVVGADRIAANGDTANKIGTYTVALLCKEHGLPFYVAAPTSTLDLSLPSGKQIPIEERSIAEVVEIGGRNIAPAGVKARHPAFDVTPARLITAIVTERGVARPPFEQSLRALVGPQSGH